MNYALAYDAMSVMAEYNIDPATLRYFEIIALIAYLVSLGIGPNAGAAEGELQAAGGEAMFKSLIEQHAGFLATRVSSYSPFSLVWLYVWRIRREHRKAMCAMALKRTSVRRSPMTSSRP